MTRFVSLSAACALSVAAHNTDAATIYSEDFSNPSKLSNNAATAELGNGGSYSYGTWVYTGDNMGVNDPAQGDGSGDSNGNAISSLGVARAQDERGTNARALSIILDSNQFASGVEYTISFDVIGDTNGGNAGRYWLALVSGHDPDNGILIDGTQNGWGSGAGTPKPFTASGNGNATINYIADSGSNGVAIEGEHTSGTTAVSFTFIHDGISDLAFAVGTYGNIFAIDNVTIDDPNAGNILPEVSILAGPGKYQELPEGSNDPLQISASDSDGSIASIRVLIDNNQVDENTTDNSYTLSNAFSSLTSGPHQLTVVTTDNAGGIDSLSVDFYIVSPTSELTGQHPYTAGLAKVQEYLRFLPDAYNGDPDREWPMIVWLHGAGNRGSDAWGLRGAGGPPSRIKNNDPMLQNFIVISPQCKAGQWWSGNTEQNNIDTIVDEHIARFRVDPDRIIITGQSMGGQGTNTAIVRNPNKYAAAVPICGKAQTTQASSVAHLPIWIFHGDQDPVVDYQFSVDWNDALTVADAKNVTFTTYEGGIHNVWTETYQRTDLYEWMLEMSYLSKHYPSTAELAPLLDQDTDGDGRTGQEEFEAGTSPTDGNSVFRMLEPIENEGDLTLSWSSVPGQRYTVYTNETLDGSWDPIEPQQIPAHRSGTNTFSVRMGSGNAFYRIESSR